MRLSVCGLKALCTVSGILLAVCCLAASNAKAAAAGSELNDSRNAATSPVPWTPVLMMPTGSPRLFQGSDNKYNLAYEIILGNFNQQTAQIQRLDITNAETGEVLKTINSQNLADTFTAVDGSAGGHLDKGQTGVIWVNLEFDNQQKVPKELRHRLVVASKNQFDKPAEYTNDFSTLAVDTRAPVEIGPPLKGSRWFASGGYIGKLGHRRALFAVNNGLHCAQRYAIDWIQITDDNHASVGNVKANSSWPTYGQPVIAVADATVYGVVNHYKDQVPLDPTGDDRLSYPGGNSITLDLGNGYYGFYAHLKPGSIRVKAGERVKRGEQIAEAGNTGNSFSPHLHFHVTDNPSPIASNGVPYVFTDFRVVGQINDLDNIEKITNDGGALPVVASPFAGQHKDQLPREGMLISFPD